MRCKTFVSYTWTLIDDVLPEQMREFFPPFYFFDINNVWRQLKARNKWMDRLVPLHEEVAGSRQSKSDLLDDWENCIFAGQLGAQLVDALGKRRTLGAPHSRRHCATFFFNSQPDMSPRSEQLTVTTTAEEPRRGLRLQGPVPKARARSHGPRPRADRSATRKFVLSKTRG